VIAPPPVPRLLLITDRTQTRGRPLEDVVAACVSAGISHVLVRERDLSPAAYDDLLDRLRARVGDDTAIAEAKDPIRMAGAMKHAVIAGREAFLAGRMAKRMYADASSPLSGLI